MVKKREDKNKRIINIFDFICKNPEKWIHIRKASRELKISPNTFRKNISLLEKKGVIEKKKQGNMILYRANMENEKYKQMKQLNNLKNIYFSGIVDFLFDYYTPNAIILFGSYSRGEDISTSDIDIAVLTPNKKRPDLEKFEKKLNRRVELSLFTFDDISKEFLNNLINGIVLKGVLKNV